MQHSESFSDEVLELAEEFLARYRRGERPPLCEYTDRHPQLADQIREVFPAMALMENIAIDESQPAMSGDGHAAAEPALQQLGDYRIIREVGRGGMGIVYEAEQVSLGRHVALKVLPRQMLLDGKQKRRFEREAKAAARLHHTNIVPVFGVGEHEGMHYYVMQFIQGLGLDQVLTELRQMHGDNRATAVMPVASQKPTTPSRGETAAAEMARSLMTGAFERTVLGPDEPQPTAEEINVAQAPDPANPGREAGGFSTRPAYAGLQPAPVGSSSRNKAVSDSSSGSFSGSITLPGQSASQSTARVRKATYWQSVAQIGTQVASALQYAHDQGILHRDIKPSNLLLDLRGTVWIADFGLAKANDQQEITHTGDILGTLRYMPPEAFEGKGDSRSDLYSLGLTLYELLALKPAFDDKDRNKLIQRLTTADAPRLESLNPAIPRDLATIVHKAIDREPGHRYQSAGALADDLQRFIDDEPIVARPPSYIERLTRWRRRNTGLATALATVGALLIFITFGSSLAVTMLSRSNENLRDSNRSLALENYISDMNLVRQLSDENNPSGARSLLERHRPRPGEADLRHFEWHFLDRYLRGDGLVISLGDNFGVGVAFSPDGEHLITNSIGIHAQKGITIVPNQGQIRFWEAQTGQPLAFPAGMPFETPLRLVGSTNGEWIAATCEDEKARVWNTRTNELREFDFPGKGLSILYLSGDGSHLMTGRVPEKPLETQTTYVHALRIWDVATSELVAEVNAPGTPLAALSTDGRRFAVPDTSARTVRLYDCATGNELPGFSCDQTIVSVAFSPDNSMLAGAGLGGITVWNSESRAVARIVRAVLTVPGLLSFSPDGRWLALATGEGTVELWDTADWSHVRTIRGHSGNVHSVAFSPQSYRVATTGSDGTVRVSLLDRPGRSTATIRTDGELHNPVFSPDGDRLVTGFFSPYFFGAARPRSASIRFTRSGEPVATPLEMPGGVVGAVWASDGQDLYLADESGNLFVFDTSRGNVVRRFALDRKGWFPIALTSNDARFAYPRSDGAIVIADALTGAVAQVCEGLASSAVAILFFPDGKRLLAVDALGTLKVWDTTTGRCLTTIDRSDSMIFLARFSADGSKLALASTNVRIDYGELRILDAASLHEIRYINAHTLAVNDVEFSPDGRRLATASNDRTVKLWDVETGRQVFSMKPTGLPVYCVRWLDNGRQLLTYDMDQQTRFLDGSPVTSAVSQAAGVKVNPP